MATQTKDLSTEEKIKEAARKIFTSKGFAAARTRDIAEEAGINLALLNYYFRSKEKLFEIVMMENFQHFISGVKTILNNTTTTLDEKIDSLVTFYIEKLTEHPGLPLFILNAIHTDPKVLKGKISRQTMMQSHFMKQVKEELGKNKKATFNPLNIIINMFSMVIFPFAAKPMLMEAALSKEEQFASILDERKKMIPVWVKMMIKGK